MRCDRLHALVVGAGVAGLAVARTLRGHGATVDLLERAAGPSETGTGIYLPGSAVRALETLGVGGDVAARAVRIERLRTSDHRGRLLFEVGADDVWRGTGSCLALPRAELRRILAAGIDHNTTWGQTTVELAVHRHGVEVTRSDGRTNNYDIVVGADGVHSTVRRLALADTAWPTSTGRTAWRFLAPWSAPAPVWSVLLGRTSALLTIPVGQDSVYCYCDCPSDDSAQLPDLLAGYTEPAPTLLAALDDPDVRATLHVGPIEEVALDTWRKGHVVLLGDAAHATSPNMAQGVALAVEDALVLADCLNGADGIVEALATYEHRRRPRTNWVRAQTHRRDRARALPVPVRHPLLRRFGTRLTHAQFGPLREPF